MANAPFKHPCLSCGACCAFFRVSFHWTETSTESHGVPLGMTKQISPHQNAMMGTDQAKPVCIAHIGVVGKSSSCKIYENRPSCCRKFKASFEDGLRSASCDEARFGKGLELLTPDVWSLTAR